MRALALLLLVASVPPALAQPAPRPMCWPSDFCSDDITDTLNPVCGTGTTTMVTQVEALGTNIEWLCKHPDGVWRTAGLRRPWLSPLKRPTRLDIVTKGPFGAFWDVNTVVSTAEEDAKYAALTQKAAQFRAYIPRPAEPAPSPWVVSPVSTGQRPSYVMTVFGPARETGKFVPTMTAGKPTACTCDGDGNSATLGAQKLCAAVGYPTAAGAPRLAACVAAKP